MLVEAAAVEGFSGGAELLLGPADPWDGVQAREDLDRCVELLAGIHAPRRAPEAFAVREPGPSLQERRAGFPISADCTAEALVNLDFGRRECAAVLTEAPAKRRLPSRSHEPERSVRHGAWARTQASI